MNPAQGWRAAARNSRSKASAGLLAMQHWHGCCSRIAFTRWVQARQAASLAGERAAGHCHAASRYAIAAYILTRGLKQLRYLIPERLCAPGLHLVLSFHALRVHTSTVQRCIGGTAAEQTLADRDQGARKGVI